MKFLILKVLQLSDYEGCSQRSMERIFFTIKAQFCLPTGRECSSLLISTRHFLSVTFFVYYSQTPIPLADPRDVEGLFYLLRFRSKAARGGLDSGRGCSFNVFLRRAGLTFPKHCQSGAPK